MMVDDTLEGGDEFEFGGQGGQEGVQSGGSGPTDVPHQDHQDHQDTIEEIPVVIHVNHSNVSEIHADTTSVNHTDIDHGDAGGRSDTPIVHADTLGRSHQDHVDGSFPAHLDIPLPDLPPPAPRFIKASFTPGGEAPDVIDLIYKRGQEGDREQKYLVTNEGNSTLEVSFDNIPLGVFISPPKVTIPSAGTDSFVITITENLLKSSQRGTTQRNLNIRLALIGESINA
jgi:hypothetical protein